MIKLCKKKFYFCILTSVEMNVFSIEQDEHTLSVQQGMSTSQHSTSGHLWEEGSPQQPQQPHHPQLQQHLSQHLLGSDRSSDRESLGELSAASVSSLVIPTSPSPSNQEQMTSIFHLVQYLNTLMVSIYGSLSLSISLCKLSFDENFSELKT